MYDENDPRSVECYSSAITLSDMEVFIFPELLYALVLANIMSPRLWQWRDDPWFAGVDKMSPQRRIHRLKQYIIDHFAFNLDLDTWGLTTKGRELSRFSTFIRPEVLAKSNALFGYEGDKYYFDIDIRRHFGLDKYSSDSIPYWKTETLEAMESFRYKPGYPAGAGECVSLSALYAAAAFVVAGISLDRIYLLATPLHSQNFIDIGSGMLTNNRRIVTRTMWFNGTELSAKARRALENEQVTIVTDCTGYIHSLYPKTTMDPERYREFSARLRSFLSADFIDFEILANFLRYQSKLQRCFQIAHVAFDKTRYIEAEKVFAYEHNSKARIGDRTRELLLNEIEEDEFYPEPIPGRLMLNDLEEFFRTTRVSLDDKDTIDRLKSHLHQACYNVDQVIPELQRFCRIAPRLPAFRDKEPVQTTPIVLDGVSSSAEARGRIGNLRKSNAVCDLAFSAFRDCTASPWKPFIKAALERNPVSIRGFREHSLDGAYTLLSGLPGNSIYPEPSRIAQPDEVWNYQRGDGLEKALCLINVFWSRNLGAAITLKRTGREILLTIGTLASYKFPTAKTVELPMPKDFVF
ncbi:MAG: hypothetical protein ABSE00_03770 [Chitinispirillaceae bacterium]|jgi:hypothetical protein